VTRPALLSLSTDDPASDGPALRRGRAHEIAGPARRAFAALLAGATRGPVLWVANEPGAGGLHPEGLAPLMDPARLIAAQAPRARDALWAAEEALRSGAAPVVVLETATPPALTPVRRLQLAAEASGALPLCLILTPEGGAAPAVETRWWADPLPAGDDEAPRWRLALLRDKAGPPGVWRATGRPWHGGAPVRPRLRRGAAA